jgi:hypothetical protein
MYASFNKREPRQEVLGSDEGSDEGSLLGSDVGLVENDGFNDG